MNREPKPTDTRRKEKEFFHLKKKGEGGASGDVWVRAPPGGHELSASRVSTGLLTWKSSFKSFGMIFLAPGILKTF